MKQACNKLSYKSQCVSPHILRHAGASNDFFGDSTAGAVES